ncbi:hypothetical protein [Gloeobacter morelensis]|uniref:Uncharacterized protein n=1 Tax=Gloeobacter morelensis MG652769 TaxID=2781736 RepID=A0ABY3PG60_9CYAN|nr:hypothetical protein [Gloeobacter morelensis]UFP92629.1 hypothetical protein ISF26_12325 [Gloeobacter morelensis MG652769]
MTSHLQKLQLATLCPHCGRSTEWHCTLTLLWESCPTDGLIELFALPLAKTVVPESVGAPRPPRLVRFAQCPETARLA